jgi:hypothetical protein
MNESQAKAWAYYEVRGIQTSLTPQQAARAINGCSWTVADFCAHPECRCRQAFIQSQAACQNPRISPINQPDPAG